MSSRIYRLRTGEEIRWPKNHRGFVLAYAGRDEFRQRCYEIRKPTPEQRCGIIFSYLRARDDEGIKVAFFSQPSRVLSGMPFSRAYALADVYSPILAS